MKAVIKLFLWELESMHDYSRSLPSATTIGKMWRRLMEPVGRNPYWIVGQYARHDEPGQVRIRWLDVILKEGPKPYHYRAPDWTKFERWKREQDRSLGCTACGACAHV